MKYNALFHAYNSLIYLSIHSFPLIPSFIHLFIHSFIHSFIYLISIHIIHWKLYPLYLHYFTKWVWGRAGACIELRTLYSKLSSHDLKFSFVCFVVLCFCLCVCVCVCMVCLFVLLCISIILNEQVNDFAFSGIFEVELSTCSRHRDDFGTRLLCNKKLKKTAPVHRIGLHMGSLRGEVIEA